MTPDEKLALLEEIMESDSGSLTPDMLLADVEEYDSIAKLSIIVMMEDEFGISLTKEDFESFITVADILERMRS